MRKKRAKGNLKLFALNVKHELPYTKMWKAVGSMGLVEKTLVFILKCVEYPNVM